MDGRLKAAVFRSYQTFVKTPGAPTDWLYYLSYASIFRYTGTTLVTRKPGADRCVLFEGLVLGQQTIGNVSSACSRGSGVCRWESGGDLLEEIWLEKDLAELGVGQRGFWINLGLSGALVGVVYLLALLAYVLPMPHAVKRKFRYK